MKGRVEGIEKHHIGLQFRCRLAKLAIRVESLRQEKPADGDEPTHLGQFTQTLKIRLILDFLRQNDGVASVAVNATLPFRKITSVSWRLHSDCCDARRKAGSRARAAKLSRMLALEIPRISARPLGGM